MIKNIKKTHKLLLKQEMRLNRILAEWGTGDYTILIFFSVIMGITAGFTGVGLHATIHLLSTACLATTRQPHLTTIIILIPVLGMLVQYFMIRLAPKQANP